MRRDIAFLEDMISACHELQGMVELNSKESVIEDRQLNYAVLFGLTIIGEAASRITPELKALHPEIDWNRARGMRNRVVHGYFGLDWEIVWGTLVDVLPQLHEQLKVVHTAELRREQEQNS